MKLNKLNRLLIMILTVAIICNVILPAYVTNVYAADDLGLTEAELSELFGNTKVGTTLIDDERGNYSGAAILFPTEVNGKKVEKEGSMLVVDGVKYIVNIEAVPQLIEGENLWYQEFKGQNIVSTLEENDGIAVESVFGTQENGVSFRLQNGVNLPEHFMDFESNYQYYIYRADNNEMATVKINPKENTVTVAANERTPLDGNLYDQEEFEESAGFLERLISAFIRSTSLGYYALIRLIMGSGVSIETLIFNKFNNTKLTLFEDMGDSNTYIVEIREVLNEFFKIGRNIAIIAYMIILIYMGIRIMLNAGAQKKAQFKELFMYWVQGIAILFLFPYVIKYTIVLNDLFVEYVYQARNNMEFYQGFQQPETGDVSEGEGIAQIADGMIKSSQELMDRVKANKANNEKEKTDYMAAIYQYAADYGWITYSICFAVIIKEWLSLLVAYFKRLITVIFLIAIFPFVSISYAIDKIGDGKSQAFSNWYKEFALNVFLQSFHVIVYVVCISLIITAAEISHRNPNENWLLILITLTFLGNGEDLLKSIFHMKGGGGETVKNTATTLLALKGAQDIVNNSRKAISNKFGAQSNFGKFRRGIGNMAADRVNSALNNSQQKANMIMASKVEERT